MSASPAHSLSPCLSRPRVCVDCGRGLTGLLGLCGDCAEERFQKERALREAAQQKVRQESWRRVCPVLYRETDWGRPFLSPALAEVARGWRPGQGGKKSLLLRGATGTGKTRAAFALLRRFHEAGRSVHALHAGDAWDAGDHVQGLSSAARLVYHDDPRLAQAAARCLHRARTCGVLLLDDLGKERSAAGGGGQLSEAVGEALFSLIEHRLVHALPVILTTNATGPALQARLGPDRGGPLLRRLLEDCQVVGAD